MVDEKIKVLNITGWGRSGSTVLGSILGELDGFFYAGEIRNIWNRVLIENRLCGCNTPFKECKLWNSIFTNAFGGLFEVNPQEMRKLLKKHMRTRHISHLFIPGAREQFSKNLQLYTTNLQKLFSSIQKLTGCNVIIDSSKSSLYTYVLSLIDKIDLYIIHLVRDPRGVAYSRQKRMIQPDKDNLLFIEQYAPFRSSLMWNVRNLASEILLRKCSPHYLLVRYEDFVCKPKDTINRILDLLSISTTDLPFVSDSEVKLSINHSVWGNPSRFKTGVVKLTLDEEWKKRLNLKDKIITTSLTLPLLLKYGYKISN